ncbi:hypothetical protein Hypma_016558 [Hypsizygus marmoreus]|uniref:Uncharacterized protein n=1 Tax=Hypsizygus marmoreus TaxID=39966 RepID=A0A369J609_HYPMA|nr:hypothetical protein Hypma_016558 [Hypsizygus marmoreus]
MLSYNGLIFLQPLQQGTPAFCVPILGILPLNTVLAPTSSSSTSKQINADVTVKSANEGFAGQKYRLDPLSSSSPNHRPYQIQP